MVAAVAAVAVVAVVAVVAARVLLAVLLAFSSLVPFPLTKTHRLNSKAAGDMIAAWREFLALAASYNVRIRHVHTDNAKPHVSQEMRVDNSGAVELSRDRKSCHRSRHVDPQYFKVRELYFQDVLRVEHVSTHDNVADLLTKPLQLSAFEKHRARAMNLGQRGGCKRV